MPDVPENLRFSSDHLWVIPMADALLRVGITDYAQQSLGDVVAVTWPEVAGSSQKVCLAVTNIEAARQELIERGVNVGNLRHKSPIDDWSGDTEEGLDPQRRDYATFATFADPDGNTWNLQEIGFTSGLLPTTNRDGRFSNPKERQ